MSTPALRSLLFLTMAATAVFPSHSADWPHLRGPDGGGSTSATGFATRWEESKLAWQVELPGKGCSTPAVWQRRIYLTAPLDGKDAVLAYDWDGKVLWQTPLGAEQPGKHRNGSGSNPSPATDGKGVFVAFKSGTLAALNMDGSLRWQTNLVEKFGAVNLFWDFGSSPVLTEKHVVMARMHNGESWLAAFDKDTGAMRWKVDRTFETPRECDNGYTTPVLIRHEGREALLTWGAERLTIHDAADGKLLWTCAGFNPAATPLWPAVASPVVVDGTAVVCFGRADKGSPRLHGVRLGWTGDGTTTNHLWKREDASAFVPTPVVYKGLVYVVGDRGQIDCIEPATGKSLWSAAFPKGSSNFYSSPTIAGGVMYAVREDGTLFVAKVEGGFELLSEASVGDRVIASVIPVDGRLLVRGVARLSCLAAP